MSQAVIADQRAPENAERSGTHMNRPWPIVIALSLLVVGVAAAPNQGPPLARVMRDKLVHAQKILEAVVTSDWTSMDTHSQALERLTRDPAWAVLKFPEYATYSAAFVRAVQDLQRAAAQRDAEKAPQAYVAVTLTCVECHRYLARARTAR
jgi:hypothetical protein